VDHEAFAGGQVVEQGAQQVEVVAVAFFVGLADEVRMTDQAPEHHPDAEQFRVHDPGRKRADEEGVHFFRGCTGLLDFLLQGGGQFAGEFLVGVGDQRIDAAEMMIEQADGHARFSRDAPHGNPRVAFASQAAQGGGDQQLTAFVGFNAAVFGRVGHNEILGCSASGASLVERAFNIQCWQQRFLMIMRGGQADGAGCFVQCAQQQWRCGAGRCLAF